MNTASPKSVYLPIELILRQETAGNWCTMLFPAENRYMHLSEPQLRELHGHLTAFLQLIDAKAVAP